MRLETHFTERKLLAQAISEWIHEPVHYDGVPTCSYSIGPVKVLRDGSIESENADAWAMLTPFFQNHGWLPEEEADKEVTATDDITTHSVSIPAVDFTAQSAANLLRMIYARQDLLNAMTRGNSIFVDDEVVGLLNDAPLESMEAFKTLLDSETAVGMLRGVGFEDGRLTLDFPFDAERPTDWQHHAKLMFALMDKAKTMQRVNTKRITPVDTEMKYFCNSLLNQLGFRGAEHKELRHVLLGHLQGYAAFRSADKMNAHKVRFAERRRELRENGKEEHDNEN